MFLRVHVPYLFPGYSSLIVAPLYLSPDVEEVKVVLRVDLESYEQFHEADDAIVVVANWVRQDLKHDALVLHETSKVFEVHLLTSQVLLSLELDIP